MCISELLKTLLRNQKYKTCLKWKPLNLSIQKLYLHLTSKINAYILAQQGAYFNTYSTEKRSKKILEGTRYKSPLLEVKIRYLESLVRKKLF